MDYRRIWEAYHNRKVPKGWHVHHLDGDPTNNEPNNLHACTPEEHWLIHFQQGDTIALDGKFVQGASEAGKKGGKRAIELGYIFSEEAQERGRHNRDPENMRKMGRTQGRKNVESGLLARIRVLYTSETGAIAGRKGGLTNRGKIWITHIKTKQDRKVTEQEAKKLMSTKKWKRGRARGGFNSWDPEKARTVQSLGGKTRAAKRWSDPKERKRNSKLTK